MKFVTQYSGHEVKGETISKKTIVDPSGYLDPQRRIENLILAGERLDVYRKDMYQYPYDENEDIEDESTDDPTMVPGYDLADAHLDAQRAMSRLRRSLDEPKPKEKPTEPEAKTEKAEEKEVTDG